MRALMYHDWMLIRRSATFWVLFVLFMVTMLGFEAMLVPSLGLATAFETVMPWAGLTTSTSVMYAQGALHASDAPERVDAAYVSSGRPAWTYPLERSATYLLIQLAIIVADLAYLAYAGGQGALWMLSWRVALGTLASLAVVFCGVTNALLFGTDGGAIAMQLLLTALFATVLMAVPGVVEVFGWPAWVGAVVDIALTAGVLAAFAAVARRRFGATLRAM